MSSLTHFNKSGAAEMVNVGAKTQTSRTAVAAGEIKMNPTVVDRIRDSKVGKGDVLGVARVAGIMAAKKTTELIPLCHLIAIEHVGIDFKLGTSTVQIRAVVRTTGKTGVEMEALTAVSVAALTIYDMCKAADKTMEIGNIVLESKTGGRSGDYFRNGN